MSFSKALKENGISYRFLLSLIIFFFLIQEATYSQSNRKNANSDNKILLSGKRYLFKEEYSDSIQDISLYYILCTDPEPMFNETLIRYSYYYSVDSANKDISYFWEETLARENKNWYSLHPPRGLINEIHQLLPFPEIHLNKKNNYEWKNILVGMKGWDNFPKNTKVKSQYQIVSDTTLTFNDKEIFCKKIVAKSKSKLGNGVSVYYFNDELGFVFVNNKINSIEIRITLVNVL